MIAALLLAAAAAPPSAPPPIWHAACAYCHENSKVGPPLNGPYDPAALRAIIRSGVDAMPPFHPSELSDEEIDALAQWLAARPVAR